MPEARKRPRFLIYDVKPVLIGEDNGITPPKDEPNQGNATQEALRGVRVRSDARHEALSHTAASVSVLPVMESRSDETEEETSEESAWVTPLDFLSNEDLIVPEEELELEPEEETTPADWESLEQTLQDQHNPEQATDAELTQEALQELLAAQPERTSVSTGLQLSSVLAGPSVGEGAVPDSDALSGSRVQTGVRPEDNPELLNAPLPSAMTLDSPPGGGEIFSPDRSTGLEGSRALFSEVRERWAPASRPAAAEARSPVTSPLESAAVRSLGQVERSTSSSSSPPGSFSRNDPVPVIRRDTSFQPVSPDLSPSLRPPRTPESVRVPDRAPTLEGFQRRDTGIRSRMGELPGMSRP